MKELFTKYINNQCSTEEVHQLLDFFGVEENDADLRAAIHSHLALNGADLAEGDTAFQPSVEAVYKQIQEKLYTRTLNTPAAVVGIRKHYWYRIAAAALFIIGIGMAVFYLRPSTLTPAGKQNQTLQAVSGLVPGGNKAVLTLSDGSQITLDSAGNGTLSQQGTIKVVKLENGQIAYEGKASAAGEMLYNTVTTPKGGQYKIMLEDGTQVWLNAASSIRYPAAFTGNSRPVEISGEVYFEVAKDKVRHFIVSNSNNESSIEVLGTHFNVNSYAEEDEMKVTLLEGVVKVAAGKNKNILKPGQQAVVKQAVQSPEIKISDNVDIEEVMAWKNGRFYFGEKATIEDIMRQMVRWYDLEFEYRGKVTQQFWGSMSRDVNAEEVFKKLEATGGVHFQIQGKKVIVMP